MADLTGQLNIELQRSDGGLQATILSSRATTASGVFAGKKIEATANSLPALFSICATAQASACASACEAALGFRPSPAIIRRRRLLVDVETVKEHLWRMLLDWPGFVDERPLEKGMSGVLGTWYRLRALLTAGSDPMRPCADAAEQDPSPVAEALEALTRVSADAVFGSHPAAWTAATRNPEVLLEWAKGTDTIAARVLRNVQERAWNAAGRNRITALPPLTAAEIEPFLGGPGGDRFVAEPVWRQEPRESSPFTRQRERPPVAALIRKHGNGLLPRLAAQLLELASLQQGLQTGLETGEGSAEPLAFPVGDGLGIAQVQAARGLLVHRVAVAGDRVRGYRILAPTEWNFHPRGVAARGLSALPAADASTLERQARLFVTAVDPCVDYDLTIS